MIKSDAMAADIHAKAFTDAAKWDHAQQLINMFDPKVLKNMNATFIEKLTPVMDFELVTKVSSKAGKKTDLVAKWGSTSMCYRNRENMPKMSGFMALIFRSGNTR